MKNNYMNKRLPECLKNLKNVRRELVNVFKIESHCIGAQRDIDVERARNIGEDWLELCVNDPVLSYDTKTGIYHEPSGQHTCAGYIWRIQNGLENNTSLWCRVADDMTEEELNAFFAYEAIMREDQADSAVMQALWNSNDPYLHKLSTLLNSYGYTIPCNKNGNPTIRCMATLFDLTDKEINDVLEFISYVFPYTETRMNKHKKEKANTSSVEGTFIKAVNVFIHWYNGQYDLKKLKKIFEKKEIFANDIKKEAKNVDDFNKKPMLKTVYLLVRAYNSGVRNDKLSYLNFEGYR